MRTFATYAKCRLKVVAYKSVDCKSGARISNAFIRVATVATRSSPTLQQFDSTTVKAIRYAAARAIERLDSIADCSGGCRSIQPLKQLVHRRRHSDSIRLQWRRFMVPTAAAVAYSRSSNCYTRHGTHIRSNNGCADSGCHGIQLLKQLLLRQILARAMVAPIAAAAKYSHSSYGCADSGCCGSSIHSLEQRLPRHTFTRESVAPHAAYSSSSNVSQHTVTRAIVAPTAAAAAICSSNHAERAGQ
jgi:hypothetical protein